MWPLGVGLKYVEILEISEIQSNIKINLYMWNLSVGLKYLEILEISRKFQKFNQT